MTTSLYEKDFAAWALQQADLLRNKAFDKVDWDRVIDEIESMGKAEHRELMSRMQVLITHLLKWQFQAERRGSSWYQTIMEQRRKIEDALDDMPSLKNDLESQEWLEKVWERALRYAVGETQLPKNTFPIKPIWNIQQILSDDFFPELNN